MRNKEFMKFVAERHAIYERRLAGKKKPWTKDPILSKYRFCNVYRELDKVTIWIRRNMTEKYADQRNFDLWFQFCIARLLNLPESLEPLGYCAFGWDQRVDGLSGAQRMIRILHKRSKAGENVFNGAYIVSTNGASMDKVEYVVDKVLTPLWKDRLKIRPQPMVGMTGDYLQDFYERLVQYNGMGSFIAGQVCADLKFAWPSAENWKPDMGVNAADCNPWKGNKRMYPPDFWTFAVSGPGSRRGLNRVFDYPVNDNWTERQWRGALQVLMEAVEPEVKKLAIPRISAQDLQNCLCEFDKYERVRLGEGTPKQRYNGEK